MQVRNKLKASESSPTCSPLSVYVNVPHIMHVWYSNFASEIVYFRLTCNLEN